MKVVNRFRLREVVTGIALISLAACGGKKATSGSDTMKAAEPDMITVQHILIGFEGTVPGKSIMRSQIEAEKLAERLLERAQEGEDFDTLVQDYTDEEYPGVYEIANNKDNADRTKMIYARASMAELFGDVAFSLDVGDVGLARYDKSKCKYGYHVIKRLD
jgi:hypothetical protein